MTTLRIGAAVLALLFAAHGRAVAADPPGPVIVQVIEYPGDYKPDGMWAGMYVAKSGHVYSGLCTHGGSALFYEYNPASGAHRLVAEVGEFLGDKGTGERVHAKIHTRPAEDDRGRIYFATGNQGAGPSRIDPWTWVDKGSHLIRYDPSSGKLEDLGQVTPNFGAYGLVLDSTRELAYLSCWDNHLYQFDVRRRCSRDLGRVTNWDANRMIALDGAGNVYGTSQNHWIWKYDVEGDRLLELPLQIPHDHTIKLSYSGGRPVLDRKQIWRYAEWDPVREKIYGIECGRSLLFEFDPRSGSCGTVRLLVDMALDMHKTEHRFPYATLAMGLNPGKEIFYGMVSRTFDYGAGDHETEAGARAYLQRYDLRTGKKESARQIIAQDGRVVFGLGACEVDRQSGRVYFCGAMEEPDETKQAGTIFGSDPFRLQLMAWDPE